MIEPATFTAVVGICSALFSPEYPVEDRMHKAQACEVFYEYCSGPKEETADMEHTKPRIKKGAK